MSILKKIHSHQDLVKLDADSREKLCSEIRDFLIDHVSRTGGHVASNMGVVELTVAIETVYDTFRDRLVFDVGHQSYIHKILTGRQDAFENLRQFGGMAGFPKPSESDSDAFVAGHASSSVSIALGMARARTLAKEDYDVVALIGDGAATGGLAFEGLNDAAVSGEPMVIILNDNTLSIDKNVGGMATHLRRLRTKERYLGMKKRYREFLLGIPGGRAIYLWTRSIKDKFRKMLIPITIFENMGFTYLGPVDGHDTEQLITLLRIARDMRRPVVIHALTQKGRGYRHSEEHPKLFHGVGKFDPNSGEVLQNQEDTFSAAFGRTMVELARNNPRVCAITAAMPGGTGLLSYKKEFPKRIYDVGIAEEHAVSMAAGMAKQGLVPVVALYSTFLQRAYDMILQDVGLLGLHVVFAVDRAGLVGEDGETHHGVFDVSFLRHCPQMTVLCPASVKELSLMLQWAVEIHDGPVAIRYPRGGDGSYHDSAWNNQCSAVCIHRNGGKVALITYGSLIQNAMDAADILYERGVNSTVVRLLNLSALDSDELLCAVNGCENVFILEECLDHCGIHSELAAALRMKDPSVNVHVMNLGSQYIAHGRLSDLYCACGLDAKSIADHILEVHQCEK